MLKISCRYCGALIQGLSVQAQDGANEDELQALVEIAASHLDCGASLA
jgi:hypothetical protein